MNKTLTRLFDYQKYAPSPALAAVIDAVHSSVAQERSLSDDEAEIWAAGEALPGSWESPEARHDQG